ncbi:MAG: response regulator [Deltaproteobacteria bacterium]|nr:MAG: response regulator [Deltaproteobacteria bacterium]TNF25268.1 MAG: response regulator [Deltaproteobacteria bacterium]
MSLEIVYIDDEHDLCEVFELLHGSEGNILTFHNCEEAIDYINTNHVDIVFIDYRMPCMNGFKCREMFNKDVPTYLVTGEIGLYIPSNFTGFIEKPIDHELIKSIIENFQLKKAS